MSNPNMPGCYGSPLCCTPTFSPCSACPFVGDCTVAADARGARLKERYGLNAFVGRGSKAALNKAGMGAPAPTVTPSVPGVNKKSVELMNSLKRKGIDLPRAIKMGVNPFEAQPPAYMRIAVASLMTDGIERTALRRRFVSELGWSDTSASSHVGIATSALVALGVAQQAGERLVMHGGMA